MPTQKSRKVYFRKRRAKRRRDLRKAGLCVECAEPAVVQTKGRKKIVRSRCATHLEIQAVEAKERRDAQYPA